MRVLAITLGLALALSACAPKGEAPAKPKVGAWGVATTEIDKGVKPGDDFFDYAVGTWLKTAKIPADLLRAHLLHDTDKTGWQRYMKQLGLRQTPAEGDPVFEDFNLLRAAVS